MAVNVWDGKSAAEVSLVTEDRVKVVKLHSTGDAGAWQFYNWQLINQPGGRKYAVTTHYKTAGFCALLIEGLNVDRRRLEITNSTGTRKQLKAGIPVTYSSNPNL